MERHGSETYFVIGEGLLGEARGGRDVVTLPAPARTAAPLTAAPPFRFSRLGPKGSGKQLGKPNRLKIAQAMTADNLSPGQIPAGFTYLGQFIDHDLTFDKSCADGGRRHLAGDAPAVALAEPRPRLALRQRARRSRLGEVLRRRRDPPQGRRGAGGPPGSDLPRRRRAGEAIIPDPRNDENLAVAQIALRVHPVPQPRRRLASARSRATAALPCGAQDASRSTTSG